MKQRQPILKIYDENVDWYIANRPQRLMEKKYLDQVIDLIPAKGSILDIGCGLGQPIASYFIEQDFKVTGIDGAQNMILEARKRQPQSTWIHADMKTLNLNQKFNAALAWDSFFHLTQEEQRQMFQIFYLHLLPGGVLLFTSGPDEGEAIGDMNGFELYHSSLSTSEYNQLLAANGFKVLHHKIEDPECGGHTIWIAQKT